MNSIKNNKKILLVEDEDIAREILAFKLKLLKIDFDEASNGDEGLKKMRANSYNLVLLDLRMPIKDGFQVLEEAGADEKLKDIPIWVLSNLGQKDEIDRALKLGTKEYFVKASFNIDDLVNKIINFVGNPN